MQQQQFERVMGRALSPDGIGIASLLGRAARDATVQAVRRSVVKSLKTATIGGQSKSIAVGQFCATAFAKDYRKYGFECVDGRLR